MSKIKKYFLKKKQEASFKLKLGGSMGQGHALNAPKPEPSTSRQSRDTYVPPKRKELSAEARAAAAAALARVDKRDSKEFNTSLAAIKAQAKRELEAERKLRSAESSQTDVATTSTVSIRQNENLACQGVFFRCPLISEEILPKKDWKIKIKEFLYQQLEGERALTACLIIHNCNTKEKAEDCIQTLTKYLENIINHPDDEKYCKIRMSNRIFSEKVRYVEGALDFLLAAGFQEIELDGEPFLLWSKEHTETDFDLQTLLEALRNAEPIPLELDRNIKVLLPSQVRRVTLPDDFYRISPEEIKREQQLRSEAIESAQVLKTKAMREREEQRNLRMYRYSLVRVKFPNGIYIQGTFNVYDRVSDIYEFVQSCLIDEATEFNLVISSGGKFTEADLDKTLYDMRLIPNVSLLFTLTNETVINSADVNFLKEELLMLVQSI
ncbi:UBX domain-containing protein 6 [Teleopsis dalmanni]|uniref:UBX domain-containing protein 6-like n=1 Tax=Teleopsis dalmanni TaxID=139649 RepID=UPI0018CEB757|nr:UBX domain-containing protein 6-like [Teleopsis dalmanni]XP_037949701.1 UBX domain-containing protein 6-like [Teleopsis dalmanni]XP_037949745.1 UBX domain-containing protein 6 [Teleopsis dalmanni]